MEAKLDLLLAARQIPASVLPELTFRQAFERYGETLTFARYRQLCSILRAPLDHFGERKIAELRRSDWPHYVDKIRTKQKTRFGGGPAISTMNQELTQSRAVLNYLVREELAPFNPWQGIKKLKGGHRRQTVIQEEDFGRVIEAQDGLGRTFAIVIFWTGMRSSEVRLMRWHDIDWTNGRIWIPEEHVKTRRSRWAPLPHPARRALEEHPHHVTSQNVFANPKEADGRPYSRCRLWQLAREIFDGLKAAPGDGNVHPHDARHSMVTRLTEAGVNTFTAMKLVGHTSAAEHWRYHHLTPKQVDDARILLERGQRKPPRRAPAARRPERRRLTR